MSRWYEDIPNGPLTEHDFERLASSFYDESRLDERDAAEKRGIKSGELLRHEFGKVMIKRGLAPPTADEWESLEIDSDLPTGLEKPNV